MKYFSSYKTCRTVFAWISLFLFLLVFSSCGIEQENASKADDLVSVEQKNTTNEDVDFSGYCPSVDACIEQMKNFFEVSEKERKGQTALYNLEYSAGYHFEMLLTCWENSANRVQSIDFFAYSDAFQQNGETIILAEMVDLGLLLVQDVPGRNDNVSEVLKKCTEVQTPQGEVGWYGSFTENGIKYFVYEKYNSNSSSKNKKILSAGFSIELKNLYVDQSLLVENKTEEVEKAKYVPGQMSSNGWISEYLNMGFILPSNWLGWKMGDILKTRLINRTYSEENKGEIDEMDASDQGNDGSPNVMIHSYDIAVHYSGMSLNEIAQAYKTELASMFDSVAENSNNILSIKYKLSNPYEFKLTDRTFLRIDCKTESYYYNELQSQTESCVLLCLADDYVVIITCARPIDHIISLDDLFGLFYPIQETENQSEADQETESTVTSKEKGEYELGEGSKYFFFSVTFSNGEKSSYIVHTDALTVGDALEGLNLIAGEKNEYGYYVKTVGKETLDYNRDGMFWAFYVNGEEALTSVDATEIVDGTSYSFVAVNTTPSSLSSNPTTTSPSTPRSSTTNPSNPAPSTPSPATPTPSTPTPSTPSPTNPSPSNPAPTEPAPTQHVHTDACRIWVIDVPYQEAVYESSPIYEKDYQYKGWVLLPDGSYENYTFENTADYTAWCNLVNAEIRYGWMAEWCYIDGVRCMCNFTKTSYTYLAGYEEILITPEQEEIGHWEYICGY